MPEIELRTYAHEVLALAATCLAPAEAALLYQWLIGVTPADIGCDVGMSRDWVVTHINRALHKLQRAACKGDPDYGAALVRYAQLGPYSRPAWRSPVS